MSVLSHESQAYTLSVVPEAVKEISPPVSAAGKVYNKLSLESDNCFR